MTNELKVIGTQKFMGIDIPVIEGGFGENQKVILAKTVAELHDIELKRINELINENIDEFEFGVDIIDLKENSVGANDPLLAEFFSKQSISNSKNIYLLSEQGYMALVQLMKTEKAKQIRKQLRREYFEMREELDSLNKQKSKLLLTVYDGGVNAVIATRELVDMEVESATSPLLQKIEDDKPYTEFAKHVTESSDTIDINEFAKIVKNEKIDIGRNKLFKWLRENKYLMGNNTPYQKYINAKYFEVIEVTKNTPYGTKVFPKTLITGKGQVSLIERLREEFPAMTG